MTPPTSPLRSWFCFFCAGLVHTPRSLTKEGRAHRGSCGRPASSAAAALAPGQPSDHPSIHRPRMSELPLGQPLRPPGVHGPDVRRPVSSPEVPRPGLPRSNLSSTGMRDSSHPARF
ncbi:hypothetical protein CapIbe_022297 [Capra ibex]